MSGSAFSLRPQAPPFRPGADQQHLAARQPAPPAGYHHPGHVAAAAAANTTAPAQQHQQPQQPQQPQHHNHQHAGHGRDWVRHPWFLGQMMSVPAGLRFADASPPPGHAAYFGWRLLQREQQQQQQQQDQQQQATQAWADTLLARARGFEPSPAPSFPESVSVSSEILGSPAALLAWIIRSRRAGCPEHEILDVLVEMLADQM